MKLDMNDPKTYGNYHDPSAVRPQPVDLNREKNIARQTQAEDSHLLTDYKNRRWKIDEDVKPRLEEITEIIDNCDAQIAKLKASNATLGEIQNPSVQVERRIEQNMDQIAGYLRDKERLEPKQKGLQRLLDHEEQKLVDTWESPLMQSRLKRVAKEQEALAV